MCEGNQIVPTVSLRPGLSEGWDVYHSPYESIAVLLLRNVTDDLNMELMF